MELLVLAQPLQVVGQAAGQELVEHHAQGIDVARGGQGLAADLFRTGVVRGHETPGGDRHRRVGAGQLGADQLGDAEVDQLGHAVDPDQDVAGLEVAVDHHVLVRELHGVADLPEQRDALAQAVAVVVAVGVDRLAVDELHDEVGQAVLGAAGIQQAGDGLVLAEHGQDLHLRAEAPEQVARGHGAPQHLDRDLMAELGLTHGEVDVAHAAAALQALHPVGAELLADEGILGRGLSIEGLGEPRRLLEEAARFGALMVPQQTLNFGAQREIAIASFGQEGVARRRVLFERPLEDPLGCLPALPIHCRPLHRRHRRHRPNTRS